MSRRMQYADSRSLLKTLSGMTRKERINYLWTYYYWVLSILVLAVIIISIAVSVARNSQKEVLASGYLVNTSISPKGEQYLTADFQRFLNGQENQTAELTSAFIGDSSSGISTAYMQVIAMIAAQELDYVIMDAGGLEVYLSQSAFSPLPSVLTEAQLTPWADRLVRHACGSSSDENCAMAIDISETPFAQDCLQSTGAVYIAFPGNRENGRSAGEILEYLCNWERQ